MITQVHGVGTAEARLDISIQRTHNLNESWRLERLQSMYPMGLALFVKQQIIW